MADWIEVLEAEVIAFLKQIASNAAGRRSNKLADLLAEARQRGACGVDRVLPFLRRNQFLSLDRQARLTLTPRAHLLLGDGAAEARAGLREALQRAFPTRIAIEELAPVMSKVGGLPLAEPRPGLAAAAVQARHLRARSPAPAEPARHRVPGDVRAAAADRPQSRLMGGAAPSTDFEIDEVPPVESPPIRAPRDSQPAMRRATGNSHNGGNGAALGMRSAPLRRTGQAPGSAALAAEGTARNRVAGSSAAGQKNLLGAAEVRAPIAKAATGPRYARYDALGEGPLCAVFRGRHSALGIDVAIKELQEIAGYLAFLSRETLLDRLQKCLMTQAALRHPCIVSVIDIELGAARPYFVLEFCPGGNLRHKMGARRGGGLDLEDALRIFGQLVHALQFMHSQGFAHGNLKPENLLFDRFGNAKLSDPGLAHLARVDGEKGLPRLFIGTGGLDYLCPEKLRGLDGSAGEELRLGITADLYGAGVLLYEMLTGRLPGVRAPLPSEVNKHAPASLDTIFERLTAGEEAKRFQSCAALIQALREAGDLPVRFDAAEVLMRTAAQGDAASAQAECPPQADKR